MAKDYWRLLLVALMALTEAVAHDLRHLNGNATRHRRSGGYPKFPQETAEDDSSSAAVSIESLSTDDSDECGTRSVVYQPQRSGKIVGGHEPPYGAYPWQVGIQVYSYDSGQFDHHCGGAVVGHRLVLTAAHCLQVPLPIEQLRLVTGDHRLGRKDPHEHMFRAEKVLIHPEFRKYGPYSNDIALVLVRAASDSGIVFDSHVRPICLPDGTPTPPPGTWCSVSGWGAQKAEDKNRPAPVLRAAAVPLLDLRTCRMSGVYGGRQQPILDTMICAGVLQGGVDACGGDSGGPLACEHGNKFVLAGVVSWGDGCAKRNRPGVYTRVESFIDWIHLSIMRLGVIR
ncbi:serine protease 33-like [Ctenocephalides felis]|uniref:serine protease 33-like n=1 Tax=Ctenocephalides felis TaxID=7515 RepID=UPI000E6E42DC|nr:serine protease 33-like [Ctenocephalides felis]